MPYTKQILGVKIDFGYTYESAVDAIDRQLMTDSNIHYVCTTNPEFIMDALTDPEFKTIINNSDFSFPDGEGVLFAEKYYSKISNFQKTALLPLQAFIGGLSLGINGVLGLQDIGHSIQGAVLTEKLLKLCDKKGYSVFFLGGRYRDKKGEGLKESPDMSAQVAAVVKERYPGVKIVGYTSSYNAEPKDDEATIKYIKQCVKDAGTDHIDFLFVAYNHIRQEKWIVRNSHKIPAKVSIGVGGTFDYLVGNQHVSPNVVSKMRLGWLYRLVREPWRLKRTLKAFPKFPWKVFVSSLS